MPRSVTLLRATLLIPWFLALVAVAFQADHIASQPRDYRAIGQFHMKESPSIVMSHDFYATQIEILESAEIRRRTKERVRALRPELKEVEVEIRVTHAKGTTRLTIAATGREPEYTRVFLDAILDEYVSLGKDLTQNPDYTFGTAQRPDAAVEVIPDLWVPLTLQALVGGSVGFVLMLIIAVVMQRITGGQGQHLTKLQ